LAVMLSPTFEKIPRRIPLRSPVRKISRNRPMPGRTMFGYSGKGAVGEGVTVSVTAVVGVPVGSGVRLGEVVEELLGMADGGVTGAQAGARTSTKSRHAGRVVRMRIPGLRTIEKRK
jgi:hypothetical protein